ncbi:YlbF family regulator [Paenibacillus aurantius]|uniref:YlbF family regulator n=1 Tax=Paenibacillus aurantius TaxID=2918900 RepID=A0AA96LLT2_9BACL|nr:YlbF family regulator [Paenibacillus aurantius]WJH33204.1 YlbF family regulator [Paenibacillus sp. CC-CFT747]WNQ13652.1 YlbF family regulator [Paenibacillus aurantius]
MSIKEAAALDMSSVLLQAYELGDLINSSAEMADYLYWKERVQKDEEAQKLIAGFARLKEKFEECERFGHFHPDYHKALEEVQRWQEKMEECEALRRYQQAEGAVDNLLFTISKTIAHAVSDTIKVPSNNPGVESGGCSSGGCSGNCSGSCG